MAAEQAQRELEPLKLPGKLGLFTGNVLYPDDNSAVWDVNGMLFQQCAALISGAD